MTKNMKKQKKPKDEEPEESKSEKEQQEKPSESSAKKPVKGKHDSYDEFVSEIGKDILKQNKKLKEIILIENEIKATENEKELIIL